MHHIVCVATCGSLWRAAAASSTLRPDLTLPVIHVLHRSRARSPLRHLKGWDSPGPWTSTQVLIVIVAAVISELKQ